MTSQASRAWPAFRKARGTHVGNGKEEKGKLAAVLVGYDPTPTVGNGLTASVHFGRLIRRS